MWRANINRVNQKQQRQRSHHHHHHDADKNNNNNNNNLSSEELKLKRIEVAISAATVGHFRTLKNSSDIRSKGNLSLCYGKMGSTTVSTKHISHIDRSDDDTLWSLIRKFDWDSIDSCLNVESCKFKNSKGSTPLHLICSIGSAPSATMESILNCWSQAALVQNNVGDTPLHEECKHSQVTVQKTKILIDRCPSSVSVLNKSGQSPLHIAAISHAMLPVIKKLVKADPSMVLVKDNFGNTPANLLWQSWLTTINGMINISSAVQNPRLVDIDNCLHRFWNKMSFLVMKGYSLTLNNSHNPSNTINTTTTTVDGSFNIGKLRSTSDYVNSPYLLHALLQMGKKCPFLFLMVALEKNPKLAQVVNEKGELPIHVVVSKPIVAKYRDVLQKIIFSFPQAVSIPDKNGRYPLNIALDSGNTWDRGVERLFLEYPDVTLYRDRSTGLYPFMLAATMSGDNELGILNTVYNLLRVQPSIIRESILM